MSNNVICYFVFTFYDIEYVIKIFPSLKFENKLMSKCTFFSLVENMSHVMTGCNIYFLLLNSISNLKIKPSHSVCVKFIISYYYLDNNP